MSDVVIAFGPNDSYFWQSQTQWERRGLPAILEAKFQPSAGVHQIKHVYEMALGANGSFYVGFRAKDGKIYSSHYGLPAQLAAWLKSNISGDTIRVSLGPDNASFWATNTKGNAYIWLGLPEAVSTVLKSMPPRFISLGFGGSYVMVSKGGGARWKVAGPYPELDKYLDVVKAGGDGAFRNIHYISLGAHPPMVDDGTDKFFVMTFTNGSFHGAVPKGTEPAALKVLESAKARAATRPAAVQQRRGNLSNFLKLANSGLKLVNALNGGQQQGSYTSDYSSTSFDTSGFQSSLQQQTWATTSSAAQDAVQ